MALYDNHAQSVPTLPFGEKPYELYTVGQFDRARFREAVANCKSCGDNVVNAPRFGTGKVGAKLAIVINNPPRDPSRCMHGALMVHYGKEAEAQRGPHELLVIEALTAWGLHPKNVYATTAIKCPTVGNRVPNYWSCSFKCAMRFLQHELAAVQPTAILCLGTLAGRMVAECFDTMKRRPDLLISKHPITPNYHCLTHSAMVYANIVEAPPLDFVDRSCIKNSWIEQVGLAIESASTQPRLKTVMERSK